MYIYCITNILDGKQYVGLTTRKVEESNDYFGSGLYIRRAIKQYGKYNFKKEILEVCSNKKELGQRERYWVDKLNTLVPNGYNLTDGGEIGYVLTEEARERISTKMKEYTLSSKNKKRGAKYSKSHCKNISKALTGRTLTEEHKKKVSKTLSKKDPHPNSVTALRQLNEQRVGVARSEEVIEKIRKNQPGNLCVLQIDKKTGIMVAEYTSLSEASRQTGTQVSAISMCCKGKLRSSNGYKWQYKNSENI